MKQSNIFLFSTNAQPFIQFATPLDTFLIQLEYEHIHGFYSKCYFLQVISCTPSIVEHSYELEYSMNRIIHNKFQSNRKYLFKNPFNLI